jgi:SAM-dependent methyltransferase
MSDTIGYNRTCRLSDYHNLVNTWLEIFGHTAEGREFRKEWEVVQSLRGLHEYGAIHTDAKVLGVGAATEWTSFYLTRHVEQVFCTDLYVSPGGWSVWADKRMLTDPTPFALGREFDRQRLVVQDMDARRLWYPDAFFDGIYSASSIEHVGSMDDVAQAMREMGRVLKPGGVIAITTEFKLNDAPGDGWGNVRVFDMDTLRRYVIEPTGCDLVDEADYGTDAETLATEQELNKAVAIANAGGQIPAPHMVLRYQEYLFTSVSVTLRKPL